MRDLSNQNLTIDGYLFKERMIILEGPVNNITANEIKKQLLVLDALDKKEPIHLWLNSPGGSVTDGMSIIDIIDLIEAPVYTYASGIAMSMGALLLAAGEKGHRHITKYSSIMVHEGSSGGQGTTSNFLAHVEWIKKLNNMADKWLAEKTGHSVAKIKRDGKVDKFMMAQEAIDYGLADNII